ncbi:MAG: YndJ family transporter, partial [Candidatus Acidiferrales bacterium]
ASVIVSMALAALWAIGEYPLQPFVHLAEMARLHGTANAFGFTLCGLIGWILASPEQRGASGALQ